jgi:mRNA-degrading endonuclease RelE of RelBE toxin-antitoxin system
MEFRIADTFSDSLARLTNDEQKSVKTTVFDLQMDPSGNGLRMHRVKGGKDKDFWSVSANMDIRIIVHRRDDSLLVCYVDHHDKAYDWAERRKIEVHPKTGAAQIVEIVEKVRQIEIPVVSPIKEKIRPTKAKKKPPLGSYADAFLLEYGIPEEWLIRLKEATEDELLQLADHLPDEAAEAVLDLAIGIIPDKPTPVPVGTNPFEHPDAQRRFRTIGSEKELAAALEFPWDKWRVFLHPSQREVVEKDFSGPARVSGSAGTGKTVVALHRAVFLARKYPESRILLTTFSDALANSLEQMRNRLIHPDLQLAERIEVKDLDSLANRLYKVRGGDRKKVEATAIAEWLERELEKSDLKYSTHFVWKEWSEIIEPWQIHDWESYRDFLRIGRKTRLAESKRQELWNGLFFPLKQYLEAQGWISQSGVYAYLSAHFSDANQKAPYTSIIVDEAQDISVPQLQFLASLGKKGPNQLFFTGDLGQRIFQVPFSWLRLGVDIRGRSKTLRINYRTSHQIRRQADLLLNDEIMDVDGIKESRRNTQSVFNGPIPSIYIAEDESDEIEKVSEWIQARIEEGIEPEEIAVFVRSDKEISRALQAVATTGLPACQLDQKLRTKTGAVTVSTMHLAKGLEFRAVVVMAVDAEVIPNPDRIEAASDMEEITEIYETERHLLYVACTRARDHLWISSSEEVSEFLEDFQSL